MNVTMSGYTTRGSLLARLSAGDDELAWEEFCVQYGDLVRRVAARRGLQPADCEDILQEVLVRLTRAMPGFKYDQTRGRFRGYLKTIVMSAVSDRFRQAGRRDPVRSLGDAADALAIVWPEADEVWEQEWQTYHVMQAMRTIEVEFSEKDRLAFHQYGRQGMSASAVAEGLGVSIYRVYQAKSRILRRLGEIIEQQIEEEG
ncbi:MAG: RNA polymerase sigma factor [Planctomycetota bacterium]|jgi:RNA polymerase sigma-70 factor (ECF subfamily)